MIRIGNIVEIIETGFVAQVKRVAGEQITVHYIGRDFLPWNVDVSEIRLLAEHDKRLMEGEPDYAKLVDARNIALEQLAQDKAKKRGVRATVKRTPIQDAILNAKSDEEVLAIIAEYEENKKKEKA